MSDAEVAKLSQMVAQLKKELQANKSEMDAMR